MPETIQSKLNFEYADFVIESGKVREFAHSIGLKNPIYFDREVARKEGFKNIPVPPTFATVMDFWNDRNFYQLFTFLNLKPENILHGEQSYEYIKDIYAEDTMSSRVIVKGISKKNDKTFYNLETTYRNDQLEIVMINKATLIELL